MIPRWIHDPYHGSYLRCRYCPQTGGWDYYVLHADTFKAEYHKEFGKPADPDLVWAARNRNQKEEDNGRTF